MLARHQEAATPRTPKQSPGGSGAAVPAGPLPGPTALFLSETVDGLNEGANFLDRLTDAERGRLHSLGRQIAIKAGDAVFAQGTPHEGIFIIDRGRVRVFYTAPSGREITLAYWTPGHFIGGPEIFGGGIHTWSGEAIEDCRVTLLPSATLQRLLGEMPNFAICLIEGLAAKGRCYSAMAQMLGTRSVIERLAQFLLNLGDLYGVAEGGSVVITRKVTHDQLAAMVGSTRQWVTMMLKRFKKQGVVALDAGLLRIERPDILREMLFKDAD